MDLKGKVAVVTGASDGIGKQVALKLAKQSVSLALVARNNKRLDQVKDKCLELGSPKVNTYVCDISDSGQVEDTIRQIEVDFNEVQILLNIAGIWQKLNLIEDVSIEEIDHVVDINLKGMMYVTHFALPILKRQDEAIIINDSSRSGITSQPGQTIYTASKWGVRGFTDVLKEDLKGSNIRVSALYQGGTNTEMFKKTGEHFEQEKFIDPQDLADVLIFMLTRPPKLWLHDVRVEY
jgi:NADP-dependent 3-hydroxy acid dehydrogenase YdfG